MPIVGLMAARRAVSVWENEGRLRRGTLMSARRRKNGTRDDVLLGSEISHCDFKLHHYPIFTD
jgi:hypothetical protein